MGVENEVSPVFQIRLVTVEKSIFLDFSFLTAFRSTVMKT